MSEREVRRRGFADPATLLVTATGPRVRLWERRPTDPDWLMARVGTADVPSEVTVREPAREQHEGPLLWTAPDVPVTVPLAEVGVTGVAGPDGIRRAIGRWIVAQLAVLHSPAELGLVVLCRPRQRARLVVGAVVAALPAGRRARPARPCRHRRRDGRGAHPRTALDPAGPAGRGGTGRAVRADRSWCSTARDGCGCCPALCRCCRTAPVSASTSSASMPTSVSCPRSAGRSSRRSTNDGCGSRSPAVPTSTPSVRTSSTWPGASGSPARWRRSAT